MSERLQKLIAACGIASRRRAEELISEGRVLLNGRIARLGDCADLSVDTVAVDGVPLRLPERKTTLLLYKPRGYVTTRSDEQGRKTVMELLPADMQSLYPVGRLDLFSEGLLLLTNDGALAQKLTHPKGNIEKVYELWVSKWQPEAEQKLREPIVIDGRRIQPPKVRLLWQNEGTARLEITIHEGRNRQIRRMCEHAGLTCTRLKRIREGAIRLGDLKPGQYRALSDAEARYLSEL